MSYDDEELELGFKVEGEEEDPLEVPDDLDFGLDEEDPDKDK